MSVQLKYVLVVSASAALHELDLNQLHDQIELSGRVQFFYQHDDAGVSNPPQYGHLIGYQVLL